MEQITQKSQLDIGHESQDSTRLMSTESKNSTVSSAIPDCPWLEDTWEKTSEAYKKLTTLYSGYFDKIHRVEGEEQALIDMVLCQLNCFLAVDVLLDQKLLLLLLNSYAQTTERYLQRREFIRLMFFLSFASKEQLEEAIFEIVSNRNSRVTVSQLVQMHTYHLQRRMSSDVLNLIGECDRSGRGLLDVYDFRLLIAKLYELEQRQSKQTQPTVCEERAKLEEALVEAQDLSNWSWNLGEPEKRVSQQLRNLVECRALMEQHPIVAESVSKFAWEYPQLLNVRYIQQAVNDFNEKPAPFSFSDEDTTEQDYNDDTHEEKLNETDDII